MAGGNRYGTPNHKTNETGLVKIHIEASSATFFRKLIAMHRDMRVNRVARIGTTRPSSSSWRTNPTGLSCRQRRSSPRQPNAVLTLFGRIVVPTALHCDKQATYHACTLSVALMAAEHRLNEDNDTHKC
jgi:hypothetical protein